MPNVLCSSQCKLDVIKDNKKALAGMDNNLKELITI